MKMLLRVCVTAALLVCYSLLTRASENKKTKGEGFQSGDMNASSIIKVKRNDTATATAAAAHNRRSEVVVPRKKPKKTGSVKTRSRGRDGCTRLGGICQPDRFICPGHYLRGKCPESRTQQCCLPVGAWSVLCAGHHNNRVRACDAHGCGAFNSRRGNGLHKAVDLVCDDYGIINAPFSGNLAGPVSRRGPEGNQYDGVKLLSDVHCVKIFNLRPYRYVGAVAQGEALGYLLPLQERFSGITSHLQLQRCDGSDPSPFI